MSSTSIFIISPLDLIYNRIKILINEMFTIEHIKVYEHALGILEESTEDIVLVFLDADDIENKGAKTMASIKSFIHDTPVIFLSSHFTSENLITLHDLKVLTCVAKPFNNKTLIQRIVAVLGEGARRKVKKEIKHIFMEMYKFAKVGETVDINIRLEGQKKKPIRDEIVTVEIYEGSVPKSKTLITSARGEASTSFDVERGGKIKVYAYPPSNPMVEVTKTLTVNENETADNGNGNVQREIRKAVIVIYTANNSYYKRQIESIHFTKGEKIKSTGQLAEIVCIDDLSSLPKIEMQFRALKGIIITDSEQQINSTFTPISIIENKKVQFIEQRISALWAKWEI